MRKFALLFILLFIVCVGTAIFMRGSHEKIELGVWTEGLYDAKGQKLQIEKLLEFEEKTDKKYSIAHYYRGWESFIDPILIEEFQLLKSHNWTPMLSANPYFLSECEVQDIDIYSAITSGHCDDFLRKAGQNLSKIDFPFYLLFAWEMNNKELEWSIPYTNSTTDNFKKAWQHIHRIFSEENVDKISWVFCPNIPDVAEASYKDLYPGDDYVDWTCLDGYNWGTTQEWSEWASFSGVFTSSYNKMLEIAPTKPIMIGEINSTHEGGDKAAWYHDMFMNQLPNNFSRIKAVVIFNENRTEQENVNWLVDINKESLEAFKQGVNSSYYK